MLTQLKIWMVGASSFLNVGIEAVGGELSQATVAVDARSDKGCIVPERNAKWRVELAYGAPHWCRYILEELVSPLEAVGIDSFVIDPKDTGRLVCIPGRVNLRALWGIQLVGNMITEGNITSKQIALVNFMNESKDVDVYTVS